MKHWRKNRGGSLVKYAHKRCAAETDQRAAFLGGALLLHLCFLPALAFSEETLNEAIHFDIPQQRADEGLIQFAEQAGLTFIVPFDQLEGVTSNELTGSFPPKEAISILLLGTQLQAEISNQRLVVNANVSTGGESDLNKKKRTGIFGAFLGLLGLGGGALAQSQIDGPPNSRYAIEEIIITSRRIEEGLQNAPIAVTAMTGVELENRGALDVVDFADVAPNVSLKTNGAVSGFAAAPRTSIRGIGQSDFVINTDPAVGLYADGVYLGRSIGRVLDLVDVERVEALRGPQGTLFGRNSTGGAINVISAKPDLESTFGSVTASIGEEGYQVFRASGNIPLAETSALRVSALKRERDGFIPSLVYENLDLGAEDVTAFRAAFRWKPSEAFTLDLDADFSDRKDSAAPIIAVDLGDLSLNEGGTVNGVSTSLQARRFNGEPGGPPILPPVFPFQSTDPLCGTDPDYRDANATCLGDFYASSRDGAWTTWFDNDGNLVRADDQNLETYGYSVRLNWELENISVSTISAWRGFDSSFTNGSPAPIYIATNDNVLFDQNQSSHEINLSGNINDRISWLAGVFYQEEDGREIVEVRFPLLPPANVGTSLPLTGVQDRNIDNTSKAIYAQLSAELTDSLELTLGGRITQETKDVEIFLSEFTGGGETVDVLEGDADATEPSFLANLSWDFTDDAMVYVQFSDGFRNGGFPARTPTGITVFNEAQYEEEFVDAWELGLKATALDGNLRANIALFHMDFTEVQINATVFDPVLEGNVATIQNIGDAEISGIELEANYLVTDSFRIDASVGYLDTELTSIPLDGNGLRQFVVNDDNDLRRVVTANSGFELPHAPEFQVNLGANYSYFFGNGAEIRNRLDLFYEDEQFSSIGNYDSDRIPSTTRLNYLVSFIPADANWELTLGARNLTDQEDILNTVLDTGPRAGLYHVEGRGREAFLQFKYSFEG